MVGMGMIFDETYRPFFEQAHRAGLYDPAFGVCQVPLAAVASRTGSGPSAIARRPAIGSAEFQSFREPDAIEQLLAAGRRFCLRGHARRSAFRRGQGGA